MKIVNKSLQLSASDLISFLGCRHLTELDRKTALGEIDSPDWSNPALVLIQQKGDEIDLIAKDQMITKEDN